MSARAYPLKWPDGWPRTTSEYRVTRDGRVYSVRGSGLHELAQHPDKDGYLCVLVLIRAGKRRHLRVHRAVCEALHGARPPGMVVRHIDGNKRNNNAHNLAWGTVAENSADAIRHGSVATGQRNGTHTHPETRRRGSDNGNSRLATDEVRAIFRDARVQEVIASDYGITQGTVAHIKTGRTWSHVTGKRHPDRGGDAVAFAQLTAAYHEALGGGA